MSQPTPRLPLRIGLAGLGFGAEFAPIYQALPDTDLVAVCRRDETALNQFADTFGVERRYTDFDALIADPGIDAVHINTPIPDHAAQTVAALNAGKHVACTVPMATSVGECEEIVDAVARSGKTYMMMETVVYSREFLYVQELARTGRLGRIQFLRGAHHQEMAGWPGYWEGLPPMHYATHAVSPLLALAERPAEAVSCFGSGRIDGSLAAKYGSPFAIETAHLELADSDLVAEVTRSLFNTAREYVESFSVFGSERTFEWEQIQGGGAVVFTGEVPERVEIGDYAHLLPEPIRPFTRRGVYDDEHAHLSFVQGAGHGGSHPHLVHEFVSSIVDGRKPAVDEVTAANWTSVGICAHESAMAGGTRVGLPAFTLRREAPSATAGAR